MRRVFWTARAGLRLATSFDSGLPATIEAPNALSHLTSRSRCRHGPEYSAGEPEDARWQRTRDPLQQGLHPRSEHRELHRRSSLGRRRFDLRASRAGSNPRRRREAERRVVNFAGVKRCPFPRWPLAMSTRFQSACPVPGWQRLGAGFRPWEAPERSAKVASWQLSSVQCAVMRSRIRGAFRETLLNPADDEARITLQAHRAIPRGPCDARWRHYAGSHDGRALTSHEGQCSRVNRR